MKILRGWKLGKPQVAVLAIVAAAVIASYYLPTEARAELRADIGYAWGALATLLGPLLRRRLAEVSSGETDDAPADEPEPEGDSDDDE